MTHTGFGRVVFGRLVCSLFYAAAILFRFALYGWLRYLAPTLVQKGLTLAFCGFGLLFSLPGFRRRFGRKSGDFSL